MRQRERKEGVSLPSLGTADRGAFYRVRPDDVLWLSRAVAAEGPDSRQVAAILVNGFVWAKHKGVWAKGLAEWVQAYSQPVNPAWMPGGKLYEAELAATEDGLARAVLEQQGQRRTLKAARTTFDGSTRDAVRAALSGEVLARGEIEPNATDFAAPDRPSSRIPLEGVPKGRNRRYTRAGALHWQGYRSFGGDGSPSGGGAGMLILIVLAGALAWFWRS